jgi:hypothetical protein
MRTYALVTGCIFGVLALAHVARIFLEWPAQVAGWAVPMWLSWIAIVVTGALSAWAFSLVNRSSSAP